MWMWWVLGAFVAVSVAALGFGLGRAAARRPPAPTPQIPPTVDPPDPAPAVWAAYGGYFAGERYVLTDLSLYDSADAAAEWARNEGLYVAAVPLGWPVSVVLGRSARAPRVPWDDPWEGP